MPDYRPGTSLPYAPPEVLSAEPLIFHPKMDVFSLGVVMHELVFGSYPFEYSSSAH